MGKIRYKYDKKGFFLSKKRVFPLWYKYKRLLLERIFPLISKKKWVKLSKKKLEKKRVNIYPFLILFPPNVILHAHFQLHGFHF